MSTPAPTAPLLAQLQADGHRHLGGRAHLGGVVGIWPRHTLVDGSGTTKPEFAFWFSHVGWGVKNHGTDPQIEIDNASNDATAGVDRLIEVALKTALRQIVSPAAPRPRTGPGPFSRRRRGGR